MSWLEKILPRTSSSSARRNIPEGVWTKCTSCEAVLYKADLDRNLGVCPKCDHHMRVSARARLTSFLDSGALKELAAELEPQDLLKFKDSKRYKDRIAAAQKDTNEKDAMVVMHGTLKGMPIVAAAFEFEFMGGSMASVVGAKFVAGVEHALQHKVPFVCFSASGGARMQEALFSLMQMAKTSAALAKMSEAGLPYISVLTDPTMGGVSASLAMLGDIMAILVPQDFEVLEPSIHRFMPTLHPLLHIVGFFILSSQHVKLSHLHGTRHLLRPSHQDPLLLPALLPERF